MVCNESGGPYIPVHRQQHRETIRSRLSTGGSMELYLALAPTQFALVDAATYLRSSSHWLAFAAPVVINFWATGMRYGVSCAKTRFAK